MGRVYIYTGPDSNPISALTSHCLCGRTYFSDPVFSPVNYKSIAHFQEYPKPSRMMRTYPPHAQEAEAGGLLLSFRPAQPLSPNKTNVNNKIEQTISILERTSELIPRRSWSSEGSQRVPSIPAEIKGPGSWLSCSSISLML